MHCIDTAKTGLEFKIVYQLELVGKFVVMLKNISIKLEKEGANYGLRIINQMYWKD